MCSFCAPGERESKKIIIHQTVFTHLSFIHLMIAYACDVFELEMLCQGVSLTGIESHCL